MNSDEHSKAAGFGFVGMIAACLALLTGGGCGQHQDGEV
jgi:hypothetical protein